MDETTKRDLRQAFAARDWQRVSEIILGIENDDEAERALGEAGIPEEEQAAWEHSWFARSKRPN